MSRALEELAAAFDFVVIDGPPLLPVADAQVLLDNAAIDVVLVVARPYLTTREHIRPAIAVLKRHPEKGFGLVINAVRERSRGYYGTLRGQASPSRTFSSSTRTGVLGAGAAAAARRRVRGWTVVDPGSEQKLTLGAAQSTGRRDRRHRRRGLHRCAAVPRAGRGRAGPSARSTACCTGSRTSPSARARRRRADPRRRPRRAARERALTGAQAVVHLAAIVGDPACARDPALSPEVNVEGTRALVRDAARLGVRAVRVRLHLLELRADGRPDHADRRDRRAGAGVALRRAEGADGEDAARSRTLRRSRRRACDSRRSTASRRGCAST